MKRFSRFMVAFIALLMVFQVSVPPVKAEAASKKLVALTFDDGPGPYTSRLIDELDKRDAKVTFFMTGQNASSYPSVVKKLSKADIR